MTHHSRADWGGGNGGRVRLRRDEAAFSMLEVLIGIGLLATGLLTLATATVTGSAALEDNRENARAAQAVRQVMESLASDDFESLFDSYTNGVPKGKGKGQE